jgi:hypothetical protein
MVGLARAMLRAWLHPESEAEALQRALEEQKRLDLFDIQCQSCGGLGVVIDLGNRFYQCPGMCGFKHDLGHPERECPSCEMVYGSKRCPECDGLGSPRVSA